MGHAKRQKRRQTERLFEAIYRGKGRRVRKLLERGVSADARDEHGSTALYIACVQGEAWPAGELLAAGADPDVESGGESDGTPLCGAASWGHTAVLRTLLDAGADPCLAESDRHTPLSWAVSGGSLEAVSMLLEAGADPNHSDAHGKTPLHRAAEQGRLSIVRALLEHGADAGLADDDGRLPLDAARAKAGRDLEPELRATLLEHAPPGSAVETRRTISVHVRYPDGSHGSSTVELECGHEEIAALLAATPGAS